MNKGIFMMIAVLSVLASTTKSLLGYKGGHMSSSPNIPNRVVATGIALMHRMMADGTWNIIGADIEKAKSYLDSYSGLAGLSRMGSHEDEQAEVCEVRLSRLQDEARQESS